MQRRLPQTLLRVAFGTAVATAAVIGSPTDAPAQAQSGTLAQSGGSGTGLPADYKPPRAAPPVMAFSQALIDAKEEKALRQETIRVPGMLRRGQRDDRLIGKWLDMKLKGMTDPAAREVVPLPVKVQDLDKLEKDRHGERKLPPQPTPLVERRLELQNDLNSSASIEVKPPDAVAYRKYLHQMVVARIPELLQNNFHVRLNAAWLLANLEVSEGRAFAGSHKPLIEVLKAPTGGELDQQMEAVKIAAARGLAKIALTANGDLQINEKQAIAEALIGELQDAKAGPWYQQALIEALGNVDLVNLPGDNRPVLLDTLGKILTDANRPLCVRAEAARAIGRIPLPQGVNMDTLVYRIVHLAQEMADAQRQQPASPQWPGCFAKLYLAFHPVSERERDMYRPRGAGLLEKQPPANVVQDGFKQIVPLVSHTQTYRPGRLAPQKLPDQAVAALGTWLSKNVPSGNKLAPYLDDLPRIDTPKAAAANTNGVE